MKHKNKLAPFLKEIMYGGLDGIVTTFAVVAGFSGANHTDVELSASLVILFGFANLFADATSMGLGNFLSVRSNNAENHKHDKAGFTSLATFTSFIIFGFIPLFPYVILADTLRPVSIFILSTTFAFASLIILACLRAYFTKERYINVIFEVLLIGGLAGLVAYIVGTLFA